MLDALVGLWDITNQGKKSVQKGLGRVGLTIKVKKYKHKMWRQWGTDMCDVIIDGLASTACD